MNVGLIFPNKDRRYKTMHLGLAYLVSWARKHHDDVHFELLDTRVATKKETRDFFNRDFDLVGMTVFSPVYFEVKALFERIRKQHPDTPVVLGGPYVTTIQEEIFEETPAEFAVYGEGEITFSQLLGYLKGTGNLDEIEGLMYKKEDGTVVKNAPRKQIKDLDSIPLPAYDIYHMDRYPLHRIVSTRGCPYKCAFCNSSSIWGTGWRARSAENIVSEIDHLEEKYGRKILVFGDNSFNVDMQRVQEFCDLLLERKTKILWSASIRADKINKPLAEKMKASGCYNVAVGIESANDEILKKMNKQTNIREIEQGIKIFKDAGIEVLGQFVIGSPYDTLETVKESIEWAKNSSCDFVNFYSVLPFKGTSQWDYVVKEGHFFCDVIHQFHSIEPRIVFETPEFSYDERLATINLAKKEGFYSNQDKKNWWFDVAKETSRKMQNILPEKTGEQLYMILKSIYSLKQVKKHNF